MAAPASNATLVLADGREFVGEAFGAPSDGAGEVVFHTGMTGYQEILTDPSYSGQIVVLTYPEIGSTGVNEHDEESAGLHLSGLVVRDYVDLPSNWRSQGTLSEYLARHGVSGITGVDTRALVRHIRTQGAMNGVISYGPTDLAAARARAAALPSMAGLNLVDAVTCAEPYEWTAGAFSLPGDAARTAPTPRYRVIAYDYGIKRNILRLLVDAGFDVTVVPANTPAAEVLARNPDGVFLSNGPGNPAAVTYAAPIVTGLLGQVPLFGICLGHQILALALGATVHKLRFGHHGANQPNRDEETGRVLITSENHGFAVDPKSLVGRDDVIVTHTNLNDGTVEGLRCADRPAFSVQFHPKASPGPNDAAPLFARFRTLIEEHRAQA